ncbi:hypothetical protein KCP73_05225 [Salmonella enterica subsp. enterica]|nr:hypothetical protein KCP73_05225 [Salmonella enterica subsp. enterica]
MPAETVLEVHRLRKSVGCVSMYFFQVLPGAELAVKRGETIALTGESGRGKSTLASDSRRTGFIFAWREVSLVVETASPDGRRGAGAAAPSSMSVLFFNPFYACPTLNAPEKRATGPYVKQRSSKARGRKRCSNNWDWGKRLDQSSGTVLRRANS